MSNNNYNSTIRPGVRASTSINPAMIEQDIFQKITTINPNAVPLLTMSQNVLKGSPPKSHVIEVPQYYKRDIWDFSSSSRAGTGTSPSAEVRYAIITVDQVSRQQTAGMFYSPQDRLWIQKTGQTVEVVMTENASIKDRGTELTKTTAFITGAGVSTTPLSRTLPGQIMVRVVQPSPFIEFGSSQFLFLGRTIHEGQEIGATPKMRDIVFDKNFVEHKEAVLEFTETQTKMYKQKLGIKDWDFQQEEMMSEFKEEIEHNFIFGQRAVDSQSGLAKYSMDGFLNQIKTNVAVYDPATITDYETLIQNYMMLNAFRYNPSGPTKMGIAGYRFLMNFNNAFKEYRRNTNMKVAGAIGLDINAYEIGGYKLTMTRSEVFKQGTSLEDWLMVFDAEQAQIRTAKNFETRRYDLPTERLVKFMVEWQGTIQFSHEQCHSLLKTAS